MSKLSDWFENLDPKTKAYLEKQPIWHNSDLIKASIGGAIVGFFVGIVIGYQLGWQPVVATFKPLVG